MCKVALLHIPHFELALLDQDLVEGLGAGSWQRMRWGCVDHAALEERISKLELLALGWDRGFGEDTDRRGALWLCSPHLLDRLVYPPLLLRALKVLLTLLHLFPSSLVIA